MEVLRDLGIEERGHAHADAQPPDGQHRVLHLARRRGDRPHPQLGHRPAPQADHTARQPDDDGRPAADLPGADPGSSAACARGTQARLSTEYLSLTQDADGVTATVRDRVRGETLPDPGQVPDRRRRRPLARSPTDIGLPMRGPMGIAGSMNIIFKADLTQYVAHRPSVLYWVLQPGSNVGGIGDGPGPHGAPLERVADRLGLRHQRSRRPSDRRRRQRDRLRT